MGINSQTFLSSELKIKSSKEIKLFEICKKLKGTSYVSPVGSLNYLINTEIFKKNKIGVKIFDYEPKIYRNFRDKNCSYLSTIDVLFNFGKSSNKIMNEGKLLLKPLEEF